LYADARIGRREALASIGAALALASRSSRALPRAPIGGRVRLRLPWPVASLDPHRLDDVACAVFGGAVFDSLYAVEGGRVVPALAETLPEATGGGARVRVRGGLKSARGRPIGAREVAASIARARGADARAWLTNVPTPRRLDALTLHFPGADAGKLAAALASPLCAIVARGYSAYAPDATGAFEAAHTGGALVLSRNERAAQGPAFLDSISVRAASDLADSLRSFEAGTDDVGWLGTGLHEPRAGAKTFDAGAVAYVLLRTGRDAAGWDAPGVAQRLADGISPSLLAHLAPGPAWTVQPDQGWGGPPCDLIFRDDSPYLADVARAVAAALSRPSHEVTARATPAYVLRQRRVSRSYALAVDVVRPFAPGLLGTLAALATSDDPVRARDAVRYPPRLGNMPPRTIARTMRVGVVCEVRVQGGRIPSLALPPAPAGGVAWADATLSTRRTA
jgi:peptide/nickel transport system substrate-binding protein